MVGGRGTDTGGSPRCEVEPSALRGRRLAAWAGGEGAEVFPLGWTGAFPTVHLRDSERQNEKNDPNTFRRRHLPARARPPPLARHQPLPTDAVMQQPLQASDWARLRGGAERGLGRV